ncbi:MAG: hypothetical protein CMB11_07715 [Euryarchaeota archaeon]|nr:hypothetical protein [Euryarchaeota archaeon]|tara:strand:- start:419 stop:1120 length:702 start_codon:yes stop_codon:yes gene_type:complete
MEWLGKLSTKRLVLAARDIGLDTRLATTREELCEAIRDSPERGRLLKRNVTSNHYEESAAKRHRENTNLVHKKTGGTYVHNHVDLTVHWMSGRLPNGTSPTSVAFSKYQMGREMLFFPTSAAVRVVKERLVGTGYQTEHACSAPDVSPDEFVLWCLPNALYKSNILVWRPGLCEEPWQKDAHALDDYAKLIDVLPANYLARKTRPNTILVAVPKPVPPAPEIPKLKEEPKGGA